ncbi:MAG: protein kinase [Planctomycetaceae bacterium]
MTNEPTSDRNPAYGTQQPTFGNAQGQPPAAPPQTPMSASNEAEPDRTASPAYGTIAAPLLAESGDSRFSRVTATHAAGSSQLGELFRTARISMDEVALQRDPRNVSAPPPELRPLHAPAARTIQLPGLPPNVPPAHRDIARRPGRSTWNLRIRERGIAGHVSGVINQVSNDPSTATGLQSALTVDDSVPEYEIIGQLGAGSMGIVYQARQTSLNRELAIKTLNPDAPNVQHDQAMFVSEAVVTANLVHPNIVPIHDLGRTAEGKLFYSMKKVTGTSWNRKIQSLTLEENLDILLKVCDAVAYAHSKGVINRDLKPENVIVGNFGEVIVLDWGLAITNEKFEKKDSVIVDFRGGGGTPVYMPPELADSDVSGVGPHSDIYLLGAILFECLEGFPPHLLAETKNMTDPQDVLNSVIRAVLNNKIETQVANEGELMEIARKAMQSYPHNRHASVEEFQEAIREYRITGRAEELMRKVESKGTNSYSEYQTAVALYEEALRKWPNNRRAMDGDRKARLAYAELAHRKGDVDLGLQIIPGGEERRFQTIRSKLIRTRRMRAIIRGTWSLFFIAALGLSGWLYKSKLDLTAAHGDLKTAQGETAIEQEKTNKAKEEARTAKAEAEAVIASANQTAEAARQEAQKAVEARQLAEKEAGLANAAALTAKRNAEEALEAQQKATALAAMESRKAEAAKKEADAAATEAAKAKGEATAALMAAAEAQAKADAAITTANKAEYETFRVRTDAYTELRDFQSVVDETKRVLKLVDSNPVLKEKEEVLTKILAANKKKADAEKPKPNSALLLTDPPDEVLLSQDGTTLLLRRADQLSVHRDYEPEDDPSRNETATLTLPESGLIDLAVADHGAAVCVTCQDGVHAWRWTGADYQPVTLSGGSAAKNSELTFGHALMAPNGRRLYLIGDDDKVTLQVHQIDEAVGKLILDQQIFGDTAVDLRGAIDAVLQPDETGIVLATGDGDCRLVQIKWNDGRPAVAKRNGSDIDRVFPKLTGLDNLVRQQSRFAPQQLQLSPDGSLLAVVQHDYVLVMDKNSDSNGTQFPFTAPDRLGGGQPMLVRANFESPISAVRFSQDNSRMVVAQSRYLELWDREADRFVTSPVEGLYKGHSLAGHRSTILQAAFLNGSPNRLISYAFDKNIRTWNTDSYADYVADMERLVDSLQQVATRRMSGMRSVPRNRYLLTGAVQPPQPLESQRKALKFRQARRVYSAEFSEDSERVIIGANDLAAHAFDSVTGTKTLSASMLNPKRSVFRSRTEQFPGRPSSGNRVVSFCLPRAICC